MSTVSILTALRVTNDRSRDRKFWRSTTFFQNLETTLQTTLWFALTRSAAMNPGLTFNPKSNKWDFRPAREYSMFRNSTVQLRLLMVSIDSMVILTQVRIKSSSRFLKIAEIQIG